MPHQALAATAAAVLFLILTIPLARFTDRLIRGLHKSFGPGRSAARH